MIGPIVNPPWQEWAATALAAGGAMTPDQIDLARRLVALEDAP